MPRVNESTKVHCGISKRGKKVKSGVTIKLVFRHCAPKLQYNNNSYTFPSQWIMIIGINRQFHCGKYIWPTKAYLLISADVHWRLTVVLKTECDHKHIIECWLCQQARKLGKFPITCTDNKISSISERLSIYKQLMVVSKVGFRGLSSLSH